jgi:Sec-independent protein secretion pathway component TatC
VSEQNDDNSEVGSNDEVRPLIDHFLEARGRIFLTIIMFIFVFSGCYTFIDNIIINLFDLQDTHAVVFRTKLKVSLYFSYFATFIVFCWQVRQFAIPGLQDAEISYANKLLLNIIALFVFSHIAGLYFSIIWFKGMVPDNNLYINYSMTVSLLTAAITVPVHPKSAL